MTKRKVRYDMNKWQEMYQAKLTTPEGVSNIIPECDVKNTYTVPSYWKDGEKPAVMNVTLENVLLVKK